MRPRRCLAGLMVRDARNDVRMEALRERAPHHHEEDRLNAAYAEAESRAPDLILLNFSDVDYINSTGIALIVSLLARARKAKRRLLACGLSDHYVEIFQITRLVDFMNVFPDEKSALAS